MSTTLDEAVKNWHDVAAKYGDFGAWDTEPRGVFTDLLEAVYDHRTPVMPTTIRDWQLYSGMPGAGEAARALTAAARKAITAAKRHPEQLRRHVW